MGVYFTSPHPSTIARGASCGGVGMLFGDLCAISFIWEIFIHQLIEVGGGTGGVTRRLIFIHGINGVSKARSHILFDHAIDF